MWDFEREYNGNSDLKLSQIKHLLWLIERKVHHNSLFPE